MSRLLRIIKTNWQCWHGTYVTPTGNGWTHANSGTRCDDPEPMYVPDR